MTNKEILQADMLDILFEHRNKLYGAYALRKTYDRRLAIALGAALLTVLMSLAFSFFKNRNSNNRPDDNNQSVIITTVDLKKDEPKPEPEKEKPKPPLKIVPDKDADPTLVENKDLVENAIGNKTQDGVKPDDDTKAVTVTDGNGEKPKDEPEVKQPDLPSYPPEFPGGSAAWLAFLQRYLQAPEDLEPGQKVEVLVQFWVDVDGGISKTEVIKSGGSSFDKEVLRVLKKMPKWKPAMQHGNLVAVAYKQPVTFMGVEQ
jgi:protein TonB